MSNIKALLVGVSEYDNPDKENLLFCKNDLDIMKEALKFGLNTKEINIHTLGKNGKVTSDNLRTELINMSINIVDDDIFIFYFSGHGNIDNNKHYLSFTNTSIPTNDIIKIIEKMKCKTKIAFIDACYSGQIDISQKIELNSDQYVEDFLSNGYSIFLSSTSNQYSFSYPQEKCSKFTYFLAQALNSNYIKGKEFFTLYDIKELVKLYIEVDNKRNPDIKQNPIFKSQLVGTVYFNGSNKNNRKTNFSVKKEYDKYIILEEKDISSSISKRISLKVMLKDVLSLDSICNLTNEIKDNYNYQYDIVFCYYGFSIDDIERDNYFCRTIWCNKSQNKEWWYKISKNSQIIFRDVWIDLMEFYETTKESIKRNTISAEDTKNEIRKSTKILVENMENIIREFESYKNKEITEDNLFLNIENNIKRIEMEYMITTSYLYSLLELKEWNNLHHILFSTIHDVTTIYNKKYRNRRTEKNRKDCMENFITRYYKELKNVKDVQLTTL